MRLENPPAQWQPQPRAHAGRFGRKEGFKDAPLERRRNARSGIGHRQHDPALYGVVLRGARTSRAPGAARSACCALVRRLRAPAATGEDPPEGEHLRVEGQVHRHGVDLERIGQDLRVSATSVLSATTARSGGCWRAKVRNCRTRRSQRAAAWTISVTGSASGPPAHVFPHEFGLQQNPWPEGCSVHGPRSPAWYSWPPASPAGGAPPAGAAPAPRPARVRRPGRAACRSGSRPPAGPVSGPAPRGYSTPASPPLRSPPKWARPLRCGARPPGPRTGAERSDRSPPRARHSGWPGADPPDQALAGDTLQPLRGLLEGRKALGGVEVPDGRGGPPVGAWSHGQIYVTDGPAGIGTEAIHGILQGHRTTGGLVRSPGDVLDQHQEGRALRHALFEGGGGPGEQRFGLQTRL